MRTTTSSNRRGIRGEGDATKLLATPRKEGKEQDGEHRTTTTLPNKRQKWEGGNATSDEEKATQTTQSKHEGASRDGGKPDDAQGLVRKSKVVGGDTHTRPLQLIIVKNKYTAEGTPEGVPDPQQTKKATGTKHTGIA
jgi:hypothetical protein